MAEKMKRFSEACYDKKKRAELEESEELSGTLIEALCFLAWYILHSMRDSNRKEQLRKFFMLMEGFKELSGME